MCGGPIMKPSVAIIGAGISGLMLARALKEHANVTVFEKSRGVAGRMATRRDGIFAFDHGTQCFTARGRTFRAFLKPYIQQGLIDEWRGKVITFQPDKTIKKRLWFEPHLVAAPHMSSLCKHLSQDLNIELETEVVQLPQQHAPWFLSTLKKTTYGPFDWVISTAPPEQTRNLFKGYIDEELPLAKASMQACFSLMIGIERPWDKTWIAAKVLDNPIKWISVNSTKPKRDNQATCFVAHANNAWSAKCLDDDLDSTHDRLWAEFSSLMGIKAEEVAYNKLHRWRYAIVDTISDKGFFISQDKRLAATSDWCSTSRIEDVWLGATKLAKKLIKSFEAI